MKFWLGMIVGSLIEAIWVLWLLHGGRGYEGRDFRRFAPERCV